MKECVICGNEVTGRGRTCSTSCRGKLSHIDRGKGRKMVVCVCVVCGSNFENRPDHVGKNVTCSPACKSENMKNKMIGSKNHQYDLRGNKNSSWKGGRITTEKGYIKIHSPDHINASIDGYVYEHIKKMSDILNRKIDTSYEVVHHINEKRDDNDLNNLQLMTQEEHSRYHRNKEPNKKRDSLGRWV